MSPAQIGARLQRQLCPRAKGGPAEEEESPITQVSLWATKGELSTRMEYNQKDKISSGTVVCGILEGRPSPLGIFPVFYIPHTQGGLGLGDQLKAGSQMSKNSNSPQKLKCGTSSSAFFQLTSGPSHYLLKGVSSCSVCMETHLL